MAYTPAVVLVPGFLAGLASAHVLPPPVLAGALGVAVVVVLSARVTARAGSSTAPLLLVILGWTAGFLLCHAALAAWLELRRNVTEADPVSLTGAVVSLPAWRTDGAVSFVFRIDDAVGCTACRQARLRLTWYGDAARIEAGQRWALAVSLRSPSTISNIDLPDRVYAAPANRWHGQGVVRSGRLLASAPDLSIGRFRESMRHRLDAALGVSPVRGFLLALALGDPSGFDPAARRWLAQTGTHHLFVVSGLHIGLVTGAIVFCLYRGGAGRTSASLLGLGTAGLYAGLAGFGLPVQRALVMAAAGILWFALKRRVNPWAAWTAALVTVLLIDPLAPLARGSWLSFGAVACLIAITGQLDPRRAWRGFGLAQLSVSLGLAPLLAAAGLGISVAGPLVNLVALPWVSFLVAPALLAGCVLLSISSDLAGPLLQLADRTMGTLWVLLGAWSAPDFVRTPWSPLALLAAAVLWFLPPTGRHRGLALVVCCAAFARTEADGVTVDVFDVGQGLAASVRAAGRTLVYDTGRGRGQHGAGQSVIAPSLAAAGSYRVDRLVVSHADSDHAGGVDSLVAAVPVMTRHLPWRSPGAGCKHQWRWQTVHFRLVRAARGTRNDRSCSLLLASDGVRMLLPGDVEAVGEAALRRRLAEPVDILLVPHHGSRTSSGIGFLNQLDPDLAIVSAGRDNRFGHPDPGIVRRYRNRGAEVLVTAVSGGVRIRMSGGDYSLTTASERWRPWYLRGDASGDDPHRIPSG